MKNKKLIMAVPFACFIGVVAVCVIGIIAGSFFDYTISEVIADKTDIGKFFAAYGLYFAYCLFPAAGMCLFKGLSQKGGNYRMLAWAMLIVGYYLAVFYSNNYLGKNVRELFGYTAGESSPLISVLSWGFWAVLYVWVPIVCYYLFDDIDPDKLIAVGAAILVAGVLADNVQTWLKQVGSRPRYKYLLTLDDPASEYRDWWQMIPNLAGGNDSYKSWPSGHMMISAMTFSLPMLSDVCKKRSMTKNVVCFSLACVYIVIGGYNRIHMTNHFLSDVCFGALITYLIYAVICSAFMKAVRKKD